MDALHYEDYAFDKLTLSGRSFPGRIFEQCTFTRCDLSGCDFAKSKFIECTFTGCDLSMIKWRGASLQHVVLVECKVMGVDLSACSEMLFSVHFDRCVLDHSVLVKRRMPKTGFVKCSLKGVDFSEADLSQAILDDCDLQDAVFERTDLRKADLATAFNFRIDPRSNDLRGARFSLQGALELLNCFGVVVE